MILGLPEEELFAKGHRACLGCGSALAIRHVLKAAGKNTIVTVATGCVEVFSTPYPESSWKVPFIHSAFENAAATASGIVAALKKLNKNVNVLAIAGDGGTADIGLQALSGAIERGHNFCYICYDNSGYMNTGNQRSSLTPKYAATTTSPAGKKIHGKLEWKKPLPFIIAAHNAPYVATANVAEPLDLVNKVRKALQIRGTCYVQIFSPCPTGWKFPWDKTIEIAKLAIETRVDPLFEIENGFLKITKRIEKKVPVKKYLAMQGRFKHLNEKEINEIQKHVDEEWDRIEKLERVKAKI